MYKRQEQIGPACKTGNATCFFQPLVGTDYDGTNPLQVFETVYEKILERKKNPRDGSYTNYLFDKGIDKILKKVGEEATELIIAAKNPNPDEIKGDVYKRQGKVSGESTGERKAEEKSNPKRA